MAHALQSDTLETLTARVPAPLMGVLRFGAHLGGMCAAMCVGIAVLDVPFAALARAAGYSDPIRDIPEIAALVVAFDMSFAMAVWMRFRHHSWRCINEMSAAMFIEAAVLIGAAAVGVFDRGSLVPIQHSLMLPAMLVPMLLRVRVYTSPMAFHAAQAS